MQTDKIRIIVADDSPTSIVIIKNFLVKQGYEVYTACEGQEALSLVNTINPDLVILDIMMPKITGLEVCKTIKTSDKTRFIPVIILTASDSKNHRNQAIRMGANDYLNKPCDRVELKLKVESLLKLKNAIDELESAGNIILALAKAVEAKDKYTKGHAERVSLYGSKIAKKLNLSEQQVRGIITAGMLHDIGKIGIPDEILNKPGKLSEREYDLIKQHPTIGQEICNPIKSFNNIKTIIRHHHERLDGTGYPDGIAGEDIDIETRIIAVADIYDALTTDRVYRSAMDDKTACVILKDDVLNGKLDKKVVNALESIVFKNSQI